MLERNHRFYHSAVNNVFQVLPMQMLSVMRNVIIITIRRWRGYAHRVRVCSKGKFYHEKSKSVAS